MIPYKLMIKSTDIYPVEHYAVKCKCCHNEIRFERKTAKIIICPICETQLIVVDD